MTPNEYIKAEFDLEPRSISQGELYDGYAQALIDDNRLNKTVYARELYRSQVLDLYEHVMLNGGWS